MAEPGQSVRADPPIPPSDGSCKITKLPSEVHQVIFEDITNQAHLLNLMVTCKDLKVPAEAVLWKKCNIGGYAKLLTLPSNKQRYHMPKMCELTLDIGNNGLQPGDLQLHPPSLTTLRVRHSSADTSVMRVDVSAFITSKMIAVHIRNGTTDEFLPVLDGAPHLKYLRIETTVQAEGCSAARFSRLVRSLPSLIKLEAGSFSDPRLLCDVADHDYLEELHISSLRHVPLVDISIVNTALRVSEPSQQLRIISLGMQANAAALLVQHLPQLEWLMLHIGPGLNPAIPLAIPELIKAIGTKQNLSRLFLAFAGTRTAIDMADLAPLKNLIFLEDFAFSHDFLMQYRPAYYEHPISLQSPLRHIICDFPQIELGVVLDVLALSHPDLQTFLCRRRFRVNDVSGRFPALEMLEVDSTDIDLTESNV